MLLVVNLMAKRTVKGSAADFENIVLAMIVHIVAQGSARPHGARVGRNLPVLKRRASLFPIARDPGAIRTEHMYEEGYTSK